MINTKNNRTIRTYNKGALRGHEIEITKMRASGATLEEIAQKHGVTKQAILKFFDRNRAEVHEDLFNALKTARAFIRDDVDNSYALQIIDSALKKAEGL